jgi:hypothetical protein
MDIRKINRAGFINAMNRQINRLAKREDVQPALADRAKRTGVSRLSIRAAKMTAKEDRHEDSVKRQHGKATKRNDENLPVKDGVPLQRMQAARSIHPTMR